LGTIAFELLLAIVLTSLVRGMIGQAAWRLVHFLTYISWPVAVLHGVGTGTDAWSAWLFALQAICVLAVLAAVAYRFLGPSRDPLAAARSSFQSAVDRRDPR
jgi:sulfoxide reductase heme-binding subunit YedZ